MIYDVDMFIHEWDEGKFLLYIMSAYLCFRFITLHHAANTFSKTFTSDTELLRPFCKNAACKFTLY